MKNSHIFLLYVIKVMNTKSIYLVLNVQTEISFYFLQHFPLVSMYKNKKSALGAEHKNSEAKDIKVIKKGETSITKN